MEEVMFVEILEACVRDELRDTGADEGSIDESLAAMRDAGMLDVPERAS
jgi:hypothetical protein